MVIGTGLNGLASYSYGSIGVETATNWPPARDQFSFTIDLAAINIYLVAGNGYTLGTLGSLNDVSLYTSPLPCSSCFLIIHLFFYDQVWRYNINTLKWTWIGY
jgi:hypothetical protein